MGARRSPETSLYIYTSVWRNKQGDDKMILRGLKEQDTETWEDVERDGIVSFETDCITQNTVSRESSSNLFQCVGRQHIYIYIYIYIYITATGMFKIVKY